ncbi:hypothetical protein RhiirC2_787305 [Rhizophagus irregularis]|uniref:Uncharacterized protein n=1 Tax=Rhizophagus irregularis TaxID=588596 RepID=A0A2N1MSG2_9GLOM|nr:hypothetical protein RhiirC2_787305 [Rhizophagus irregularis]
MEKQDFKDSGFEIRTAVVLADFAKKCKDKRLRFFFSYFNLNEVLAEYGLDEILNQEEFSFKFTINEKNDYKEIILSTESLALTLMVFKHCIKEILSRLRFYKTLHPDSLKAICNEYIVALLHVSIYTS